MKNDQSIESSARAAATATARHRLEVLNRVERAGGFGVNGELILGESESTGRERMHEMWIVDESLAFARRAPAETADGKNHGFSFFRDPICLMGDDGYSLGIVFFMEPGRDDFEMGDDDNDPVMAGFDMLENFEFDREKVDFNLYRRFRGPNERKVFIVADLTPSMIDLLRYYDFTDNLDSEIRTLCRKRPRVIFRVVEHAQILQMARARNDALLKAVAGDSAPE